MKIAHITYRPANDPNEYSGISKGIQAAFNAAGVKTDNLTLQSLATKLCIRFISKTQPNLDPLRNILTGALFAHKTKRALRQQAYDLIVTSFYRNLAGLDCSSPPAMVWADTSFLQSCNYYPEIIKESSLFKQRSRAFELERIRQTSHHIFSNNWATQFHRDHHEIDKQFIHCVHYGPNLDAKLSDSDVAELWAKKSTDCYRIIFSGVNFKRKGGDILIQAGDILVKEGVKFHIDAVGCNFPPEYSRPYVTNHGFINRKIPEQAHKYEELWSHAHLCVLPTRADCLPQVLLEAAYYGIPSITTETGGVSDAIVAERTGELISHSANANEWAKAIRMWLNQNRLDLGSREARLYYNQRFTWKKNISKFIGLAENTLRIQADSKRAANKVSSG